MNSVRLILVTGGVSGHHEVMRSLAGIGVDLGNVRLSGDLAQMFGRYRQDTGKDPSHLYLGEDSASYFGLTDDQALTTTKPQPPFWSNDYRNRRHRR